MKVRQLPVTVNVGVTVPVAPAPEFEEGVAVPLADEELEGEGLVAPGLVVGVGLAFASGGAATPEALEQVLTTVVTGTGFGVGDVLPTGAVVPPVDGVWPAAEGVAEVGACLGLIVGAWLGFLGVLWLGVVVLL
jgi:hypothetical protein